MGEKEGGRKGEEKLNKSCVLQLSYDIPLCSLCVCCQRQPTKEFGPPYHWERATCVCVCVVTGECMALLIM